MKGCIPVAVPRCGLSLISLALLPYPSNELRKEPSSNGKQKQKCMRACARHPKRPTPITGNRVTHDAVFHGQGSCVASSRSERLSQVTALRSACKHRFHTCLLFERKFAGTYAQTSNTRVHMKTV